MKLCRKKSLDLNLGILERKHHIFVTTLFFPKAFFPACEGKLAHVKPTLQHMRTKHGVCNPVKLLLHMWRFTVWNFFHMHVLIFSRRVFKCEKIMHVEVEIFACKFAISHVNEHFYMWITYVHTRRYKSWWLRHFCTFSTAFFSPCELGLLQYANIDDNYHI